MILEILTCAMMSVAQTSAIVDTTAAQSAITEVAEPVEESADDAKSAVREEFWKRKKCTRLGYEFHTVQNAFGAELPVSFGVGLSRCRSIYLHKKPIAGIMKFAIDHGFDVNYSMFDTKVTVEEEYDGPLGYLGSEAVEDFEAESGSLDMNSIGMHYASVGYALGASLTVNPVSKLRVSGYFHFVPSAAVILSGTMLNVGFMPYCKYGMEVSFNKIGVGVEWGSGVSGMTDYMQKLVSDTENPTLSKSDYYSNYTRIYLALRLGKSKR